MLQPGDVFTAEIDGLGTQQHTVVLEPEAAASAA
jgi:2-keto-4-pentenoate hydratase/2-oxohepta-3-ene-1,7-dioic acid hydratase in catechol pathway